MVMAKMKELEVKSLLKTIDQHNQEEEQLPVISELYTVYGVNYLGEKTV